MMEIKLIEDSFELEQIWSNMDNSSVFSDINYLKLVKDPAQQVLYFALYQSNKIIGGITLVKIQSKFFNHYSFPNLTPHQTFICSENLSNEEYSKVFNLLLIELIKLKADSVFLSSLNSFKICNVKIQESKHITYQIDLSKDLDEIFSNFRSDKKRSIKKEKKDNITVSYEKNTDLLKTMIQKTYDRQSKNPNWISSLEQVSINYKNSFQISTFIDKKCASSLFFVFDKNTVYYLSGGFDESLNNYNAGPIAMWYGIKKAKELNKTIFDFEGSDIENIQNYFASFGAEKKHYFSLNYNSWKFKFIKKSKLLK